MNNIPNAFKICNICLLAILLCSVILSAQDKPQPPLQTSPKTALLIIDIQDFYFPGGKLPLENPETAELNAKKLLDDFRAQKQPVIHVRHNSPVGGNIRAILTPIEGEKVISKNEVNSFKNNDLLDYLHNQNVSRLIICGMQTHMCVEAATRAAADFGFQCILVQDACATRHLTFAGKTVAAQDVHYATLHTISDHYGKVIDTATYFKDYSTPQPPQK